MGSDSGKWEENYDCAIGLFVVLLVRGPIRVKQNGIAEVESDLSCKSEWEPHKIVIRITRFSNS